MAAGAQLAAGRGAHRHLDAQGGAEPLPDRLRRRREEPTAEPPDQVDPGPPPDRGLQAGETGRTVAAAMAALPERQREAIVLCHYQELSNIDAAALMGVSIEALESLLARARRAFAGGHNWPRRLKAGGLMT